MAGYKTLVADIIEGLSLGNLNVEGALEKIDNSDISLVYKKGLLKILCKDGAYLTSSDMIRILLSYGRDEYRRVALFEKVSKEQYIADMRVHNLLSLDEDSYDYVKLPLRGTKGSAGYDFICPVDITLRPGESIVVCTGIRCLMKENWVLKAYPRSSSGTKYRVQFNNTIPVIDSDYYYSKNEGHIMFKIFNDSREGRVFELSKGDKLCQGVFVEYGITFDDEVSAERTGGFGSTGK